MAETRKPPSKGRDRHPEPEASRQNRDNAASPRPTPSDPFPPAWLWFVDEAVPEFVKKRYSPRESWKSKPFSKEDALFFFRGIDELSELFTEERPKHLPSYFRHPKFRSSYLLYFLPLQAAKFLTLYRIHAAALEAALDHGRAAGALRIADLGAGPGTASIALLLSLLSLKLPAGQELPPIEMDWLDTNLSILEDGKALAEELASRFPRLRGKLTVRIHEAPWWDAPKHLAHPASLILLGHVLNESPGPSETAQRAWTALLREKVAGGGLLLVEPAAKRSSQYLSRLRDGFFESDLLPARSSSLWGPCLHAGRCPLAEGRDWCHFSVPARIPGTWFKEFSKGLGSERQWVKFSYLWVASPGHPAPEAAPGLRRVISDPLEPPRNVGGPSTVLLCEPEAPARYPLRPRQELWRGDLIRVESGSKRKA